MGRSQSGPGTNLSDPFGLGSLNWIFEDSFVHFFNSLLREGMNEDPDLVDE